MALPDFPLPPWQMCFTPEGEPATVPASDRLLVPRSCCQVAYLTRLGHHVNSVGTKNSARPYAKYGMWIKEDKPDAPVLWLNATVAVNEARIVASYLEYQSWERLICFDSNLNLARDAYSCVHRLKVEGGKHLRWMDEHGFATPFLLPVELLPTSWDNLSSWYEVAPDSDLEALIQRAYALPNSDCRFSLEWSALSPAEETARLCVLSTGAWQELRDVVRWIALCDERCAVAKDDFCLDVSLGFWRIRSREGEIPLGLDNRVFSIHSRSVKLKPHQKRLVQVLNEHFGFKRAEFAEEYSALQEVLELEVEIAIVAPTGHERIEARLQLRDWLQGKVPSDELDSLL